MRNALTLLAVACMAVLGCSAEPVHVGTVVQTQDLEARVANEAPVVPVRCADGRVTTLKLASGPTYVVAFVPPADPRGCGIDPRLAKLADDLLKYSVSVVQVTQIDPDNLPAARQPERCAPPIRNRMLLLDPEGAGWRAFGSPGPGALMVVSNRGEIVRTGTMEDLDSIYQGALDAAAQFQRDQQDLLFGWSTWIHDGWN